MPAVEDIGVTLEDYNLEDIEVEDIILKYEEIWKAKEVRENKSNVTKYGSNTVTKQLLYNEHDLKLEDNNLEDIKVEDITLKYDETVEAKEVWENKSNIKKYGPNTVTEIFHAKSEIKIEPEDIALEDEINGCSNEEVIPSEGKIELTSYRPRPILALIESLNLRIMNNGSEVYETNSSFQCETTTTKEKLFICRKFDASYKHKTGLNNHITSVHSKKKLYNCNECDFSCVSKSGLSTHLESVHSNVKPFKCNECNHSCRRKELMSRHIQEVHKKIKPFKRNECKKKISDKYILSEHIDLVQEKKKKQPSYNKCDKSVILPPPIKSGEEMNTKKFKRCDNSNLKSKAVTNEQQQTFQCDWCDISFTRNFTLTLHIRSVHEKEKSFKCDECPASFFRKDRLERHIRGVHKKLKPLQCTICNYSSHRKDKISRHFRGVHENIKPKKCDECNYSCYTNNVMAKHIHKVHKKLQTI